MLILGQVAKKAAEFDIRLISPHCDYMVLPLAQKLFIMRIMKLDARMLIIPMIFSLYPMTSFLIAQVLMA